jgi:hypothetical protein
MGKTQRRDVYLCEELLACIHTEIGSIQPPLGGGKVPCEISVAIERENRDEK